MRMSYCVGFTILKATCFPLDRIFRIDGTEREFDHCSPYGTTNGVCATSKKRQLSR